MQRSEEKKRQICVKGRNNGQQGDWNSKHDIHIKYVHQNRREDTSAGHAKLTESRKTGIGEEKGRERGKERGIKEQGRNEKG